MKFIVLDKRGVDLHGKHFNRNEQISIHSAHEAQALKSAGRIGPLPEKKEQEPEKK